MAVDCYVYICQPLCYEALLSPPVVGIVAVSCDSWCLCHGIHPNPVVLLQRLPYCGHWALPHIYCEHMGMARLACGDTHPNIWYGLATTLLSPALDFRFIGAFYALVLRVVSHLPCHSARYKALGTCGPMLRFSSTHLLSYFSWLNISASIQFPATSTSYWQISTW